MLTPPSGGEAEQVNDSVVIAERLLDAIDSAKLTNVRKSKDFRSTKAMEWSTWSDSKLAVLLFPNITRSYSEAYEAFGYVQAVPHFSLVDKISNQVVGSLAMWLVSGARPVCCGPVMVVKLRCERLTIRLRLSVCRRRVRS